MENTGKVLFPAGADGDSGKPEWHVAMGDQWIGPMTAADVYQKVVDQEISWVHYVWKPGQKNWIRICDSPTFQAVVPSAPPSPPVETPLGAVRPSARKKAGTAGGPPPAPSRERIKNIQRIWYLYYNEGQYGPFSGEEIERFLKIGKIHAKVHAWREGMDGWEQVGKIDDFADVSRKSAGLASSAAQNKARIADQRKAPRSPIIAKVLVADGSSVSAAVCRDVSVGGMQVLTDRAPGPVGTLIKLNVSPSSKSERGFEPFVAKGVVVRILEDGRGFSFRFESLPEASRLAIESYLKGTGTL